MITLVMPTIAWDVTFCQCAKAALEQLRPGDQALVVFDGVPDPAPDWLVNSGASLLSTGQRQGPGAARNLAAAQATGDLLVFVDADVQLHPDALSLIRRRFAADSGLMAVFGSYDDQPAAAGLVSRFRNLLHHHTHSTHPGPATTFWAGLGAIRREAFLAVGGFDAAAYPRPSIEDIELGLRLTDAGHRILLDPAIQGTHHKRWTLGSMLVTDIRQRAIPWSRLLLERRELPATLNLDLSARLSAAASLLLLGALPTALVWPTLSTWALLAFCCSLALLLGLNQPFHRLLRHRMGWLQGFVGIGLHALYLAYSSLTFVLVSASEWLHQPLRAPEWLQRSPGLQRGLTIVGLALLVVLSGVVIIRGELLAWQPNTYNDLGERFDEWRLFKAGIYPSDRLATAAEQAISYFRTTVYLPWALPLFGPLFAGGGLLQGMRITQSLSLLALIPIALIGRHSLRPWGTAAAWMGALAPLAIAGNSSCLNQTQFAIICMGLISLQWLLQKRGLPVPAGLCWALAMVKPQIAVTFALTLLLPGQRRGLGCGLALLTVLSAIALLHTRTSPIAFMASWLQVLPHFVGKGNQNVLAWLVPLTASGTRSGLVWLILATLGAAVIIGVILSGQWRFGLQTPSAGNWAVPPSLLRCSQTFRQSVSHGISWCERSWQRDPLVLVAVLAVVGQLSFYHVFYDNILLFPALLACWRLLLQHRTLSAGLFAALMSASLWTPQRLLRAWPGHSMAQALFWFALGVTLAWMLSAPDQGKRAS